MKSSSGFTKFEVLLIIVVLAILYALLFPAVGGPEAGSVQKSFAKNDAISIASAITAYQTEYGYLPSTNGAVQDVGGPILQALLGSNTTLNPRGIVFLEVQPASKRKSGLRDSVFVDPWGVPYKVKFDTDGDWRLSDVGPSGKPPQSIQKVVAVWNEPSTHPDHPKATDIKRRSVTSWD